MSFKNLPGFKKRLKKRLVTNPENNVDELVTRACLLVRNRAIDSIAREPKSGIMYGKHQASAPGEAPAQDMGTLAQSIIFEVTEDKRGVIGQIIAQAKAAPYARALEFGNKGNNLQPRPFMQPALESQASNIIKMFKKGGLIK